VIIGAALGSVVTSLVEDIIMPPIGLVLGGVDFSGLEVVLKEAAGDKAAVAIRYGAFLNAVIAFVVIGLVVFWISKAMIKPAPAEPTPATKSCPYCRETVLADATKCKFCGSSI